MINVSRAAEGAGLDTGNVTVMLGMLESIFEEASDDVVMADFAHTVALAIVQLRNLQQLAYQTMIEIEAEQATGRRQARIIHRKPH